MEGFLSLNKENLTIKGWRNELKCGNKQPFIGVEAVEPLSRLLSLSSFERKHKLVVFWCADRMNSEASNNLKMVEEPGKDQLLYLLRMK